MTATYQGAHTNWLQRETPLGIPIFTPFQVRPWTENCLFAIDAQIVRMVYIGGLSDNDPTVWAWTLYAPAPPERRGVTPRNAWLTSQERFAIALLSHDDLARGVRNEPRRSHQEELTLIESVSGLSRRQLAELLRTSHTTLNSIARSERTPRASLALRIARISRLILRIVSLYRLDSGAIRTALTSQSFDGKSALDYVIAGDYENAATAAQFALKSAREGLDKKRNGIPRFTDARP
jgi:transcriptional regulator with XRE-family HTH domain